MELKVDAVLTDPAYEGKIIQSSSLTADRKHLFVAGNFKEIHRWDLARGVIDGRLKIKATQVAALGVDASGQRLIGEFSKGRMIEWPSGAVLAELGAVKNVWTMTWSAGGLPLVAHEKLIKVFDAGGTLTKKHAIKGTHLSVRPLPDGRFLVGYTGENQSIHAAIGDPATGKLGPSFLIAPKWAYLGLSPSGTTLFVREVEGPGSLIDLATGKRLVEIPAAGKAGRCHEIHFLDERRVLTREDLREVGRGEWSVVRAGDLEKGTMSETPTTIGSGTWHTLDPRRIVTTLYDRVLVLSV